MVTIFAQQINLWAVLLGAVLAMVLGFLWYMYVFGNMWAVENKFDAEEMQKNPTPPYVYLIMFVGQVLIGLTLAWILKATEATTYLSMLRIVVALWGAFTFIPFISTYLNSWRSLKLTMIDSGYYLVAMLITGSLLFVWK